MGFFKRLLGICRTQPPADPTCWKPGNGKIEVDLAQAAELGKPGGAIRLEGSGLADRGLNRQALICGRPLLILKRKYLNFFR